MPGCLLRALITIAAISAGREEGIDGHSASITPMRAVLRADWTHPTESVHDGSFRITDGTIESVRALRLTGGQIALEPTVGGTTVHFRSAGPASWCGLELEISAAANATVQMTLNGCELTAPVSEIVRGGVFQIDSPNHLRLRRDSGDMLAVRVGKTPLIYAPGESVDFEVEFRMLDATPATLKTHFQVALRTVRGGDWLFSREVDLRLPTNTDSPIRRNVTVRMPSGEGVYDLVLRAEPEGRPPESRIVQFVVLNPSAGSAAPTELDSRTVQEIDPSQPTASGPWYSTRRLRARTSRLGQLLWTSMRHPFGAQEHAKDSPIVSYRLNVEKPGMPHLVSIDYEDPGNLLLAASISEVDPHGCWTQLPISAGIRSGEKPTASGIQSHQLVCWPQTKQPTISLSVDGSVGLSAIKKVRVQALPNGLPRLDFAEGEGSHRLFGLYLDNPDIWASWSSGRSTTDLSRMPVDDWRTFLDSANHLVEYARFSGHNSVMATVLGQGGVLYPSTVLDTTLRLDSGTLSDVAPDPVQKDVVELILRICQRNQMSFVPSLRFDGSISSLDTELRKTNPHTSGLILVSRDGAVWDAPAGSALQPGRRYNPLNPQVQAAMLDVIRELVARYGKHPAFEGIAVDLAQASHAVLPGLEWGYDDDTIQRFQSDTGVEFPAEVGQDATRFARRYQILTTTARDQWIGWRCRQLSEFYETMLRELQRSKPRAPLLLNLTALTIPVGDDPRDAARSSRTIEESLRSRGIDLRNWAASRDIVVLRPFAATAGSPEGLQLNASRDLDDLMALLPNRGSVCLYTPEVLSVAPGPDKNGESANDSLPIPITQPGRSNIRRYAQSLGAGDCSAIFEGGNVVPMGHEQMQREFARVFRALPARDFQAVETLQPVVLRSCRESRDTLVYLVNDASYSVETDLAFHCSPQSVLSNGATGDRVTSHTLDQGLGTRIALEPFQTLYLRISGPDARVAQCDVFVPQAAQLGLKLRFDRLRQAMAIMGSDSARTLDGLPPNGDFEEIGDNDSPAAWLCEGDGAEMKADSQIAHGGTSSLRLKGNAGCAALSEFFVPPDGRALAMNVWLRASRPGMRVRWFLAGEHNNDTVFRCYADVTLGPTWEPKQFRARDLPAGQIQRIQIKFQVLDEGTLWIDEARVCALPISQDEKLAISKSVSATFKAWKERRWSDFERLSDGYWPTYLVESVESARGQ